MAEALSNTRGIEAYPWHDGGMARTRISTTVSTDRIDRARQLAGWSSDAELIDAALAALLRQYRAAEIDEAYERAYAEKPATVADEWGDLASFREAAARS